MNKEYGRLMVDIEGISLSDAYKYTSRVMTENTLKDDAKEGIDSFLEKRDPNWSDS